ncbi:MAG TPA: nucleoside/nucleotide kinase family protein [Galbitalea sp.]|jgi:pantothenate kinase
MTFIGVADLADLADRARSIQAGAGRRVIIGIAGPPGVGKSTIASRLVDLLGPFSSLLPLDGYHLSNRMLAELGRSSQKGSPDTFDVFGYLSLLDRLRQNEEETVYSPSFDRQLDEPIAGDIAIPRSSRIIITEGNYLLTAREGWTAVRGKLDAAWYVDGPHDVRLSRLTARHIEFGKDPEYARSWASGPDEANAALIAESRDAADMIVVNG